MCTAPLFLHLRLGLNRRLLSQQSKVGILGSFRKNHGPIGLLLHEIMSHNGCKDIIGGCGIEIWFFMDHQHHGRIITKHSSKKLTNNECIIHPLNSKGLQLQHIRFQPPKKGFQRFIIISDKHVDSWLKTLTWSIECNHHPQTFWQGNPKFPWQS